MNPFNYISIAQGDNFYDRIEETKFFNPNIGAAMPVHLKSSGSTAR